MRHLLDALIRTLETERESADYELTQVINQLITLCEYISIYMSYYERKTH